MRERPKQAPCRAIEKVVFNISYLFDIFTAIATLLRESVGLDKKDGSKPAWMTINAGTKPDETVKVRSSFHPVFPDGHYLNLIGVSIF
jgi:hypothetical protein